MIVGAYVRRAAPDHPAGAEWCVQDTLSALAERGHACRVLTEQGHTNGVMDGVSVYPQPSDLLVRQHFAECDVMLTHLEAGMAAQLLAVEHSTPLVHLIHSRNQIENTIMPGAAALVVYNAWHVANDSAWWPGASLVVHPVVNEQRVACEPAGGMVTLVNVSHHKGGATLIRLAEAMPERVFIGVVGAYGEQVFGPDGVPGAGDNPLPAPLPGNLGVSAPTPSIQSILAASRCVLQLARDETYGRVAHEAMLSGIPVIAHATPGVAECCGDAALYVANEAELRRAVATMFTAEWNDWHAAAAARAVYLRVRQAAELEQLELRLEMIAGSAPRMSLTMTPHHA